LSASSRQGRFLFLTAAFATPVAAQEPPAGEETVIVVTGAGLPETPSEPAYGTQVIDRERLVTSPSGRIEDSLATVAGFQQFRRSDSRSANPSAQGATLRALGGNASSRALVLLDGVPLADPFFGYIPFSAIAPERLASARVTRGGGSGPFGAGALAGTIELASAGYTDLGPASAAAFANDRGDTEASAVLATQLGEGFASLSGRWDRGNGFWTTPLAQRVPASVRASFDAWSAEARAVAPLGNALELQARMSAWRDDRTLRFAGADSSMEGEDASIRLVGRGDWQFDVLGYIQSRNFTNIVVSSTAFVPTLDQRNTPATGLGGKLELRPPVGPDSVVRLGLDYRRASGTLYEDAISTVTGAVTERRTAGGTNSDLGLFAEIDRSLGPVVLTGGLRADHFTIRKGFYRAVAANGMTVSDARYPDRSGWDISMRGGAALEAGGGLRLRAAGYTGLRLPTLNELYRPFVVFPVVTRANAALRNERLEGFEAGVDYAPSPSLEIALTAFDNRVRNAVANVTIGPNLRERQNIDAIRARGIEAGTRLSVGALQFDSSLAWTAAEARGSGPASALMGKRPAQTPQFAASTTLAWKPSDRWLLSTTLRHVGAQFEDDLERDVLPAATTLDVYAQLPLGKRLSLVVRGENLFDETVVTRNQGGSIDLGTPRTVWLGIKVGG
jgi:outer membrane receptor protein involved in Fe transport